MKKDKSKNLTADRRHKRVRAKIEGTADRPRISVFKSLSHVYAQLIDDTKGVTLASAKDTEIKGGNKTEKAFAVGKLLAEKAKEKKISQAVFDKGASKYHGRVKAVADGAREAGLKI